MRHRYGNPLHNGVFSRNRGPSAKENTLIRVSFATHEHLKLATWHYAGAMGLQRSGLTICAIAVLLAGCGGGSEPDPVAPGAAAKDTAVEAQATVEPGVKVIQPGAPGEDSKEVVPTPTPKGGDFTPEDVEFM